MGIFLDVGLMNAVCGLGWRTIAADATARGLTDTVGALLADDR